MKAKITRYISITVCIGCMILLMSNPSDSSAAVKNALGICASLIIPSLLPFFIISGIVSSLGLPEMLSKNLGKTVRKLFGFPEQAAAPLLLGFMGGYPVGAASLAQLVKRDIIKKSDAGRILAVCNNTGPAFIIGAVGGGVFSSAKIGAILYFTHIAAAISLGILFSIPEKGSAGADSPSVSHEYSGIMDAVSANVRSSVEKSLSVCGFVIFFSIVSAMLEEMGIITSIALLLSRLPGIEIGFCRSLIAGILELGGGIASMSGMAPSPANCALASFILGYGSLSVHCQTIAVVSESKIKCARHFTGRILHGLISAFYSYALVTLFKI